MRYTFLDYFRSRRFFILLGIGLVISLLLTAIVGYYRPVVFLTSNLGFYAGWWGMSASFVIVLSAIFFGGDAISGEFQNKTGYFTLPNPIRRSSIYVGKYLAAFLAASAVLLIFTAITVANGIYYFGLNIPTQFGESFLFSWLYLATALGVAFFFSSLFKGSSISILVSVILLLFGFAIIQSLLGDIAQIEPWFILTYGSDIVSNVLQATYPAHVTTATTAIGRGRNLTITTFAASIPEGLAIMGLYLVITAALGLLLFERKEFN
jgi:ABC-2 type transport system permease protein